MQRSMLVTAIALKRYHLRHGAYSAALADLAPEFLPCPPLDVMDGQPLRYHLQADGSYLLYSVGLDGEDNGGDPAPPQPAASQASATWWSARDAVWPSPATAEMVKSDLENAARGRLLRRYGRAISTSASKAANPAAKAAK